MTARKILVAAAIEAGSSWANAINVVKTAEGLAKTGAKVTVLCRQPESGPVDPKKLAEIYGLKEDLRWVQLRPRRGRRSLDAHNDFLLQSLPHLIANRYDAVYARNYMLPWATARLGIPTVVESHAHVDNLTPPFLRLIAASNCRGMRGFVTISETLKRHYAKLGVPDQKLRVVPDAVDLDLFELPDDLPPSPFNDLGPHIVYAGHLYDYKGIPTILEAAQAMPDATFHLVGGWPADIARHQAWLDEAGARNVILHGTKLHSEMPPYLWHADVLLLPPSARHPSAAWTSPVKLGEYMAARRPIIASDIPALRDWLGEEDVFFFQADSASSLENAIRLALTDQAGAQSRVQAAAVKVQHWTYAARAAKIETLLWG